MTPNFSSALMPLVGSSSIRSRGRRTVAMAMSRSLRTPWGSAEPATSRYSVIR